MKRKRVLSVTTLDPIHQSLCVKGFDGPNRKIVLEVPSRFTHEFTALILSAISRNMEVRIIPGARLSHPMPAVYTYA